MKNVMRNEKWTRNTSLFVLATLAIVAVFAACSIALPGYALATESSEPTGISSAAEVASSAETTPAKAVVASVPDEESSQPADAALSSPADVAKDGQNSGSSGNIPTEGTSEGIASDGSGGDSSSGAEPAPNVRDQLDQPAASTANASAVEVESDPSAVRDAAVLTGDLAIYGNAKVGNVLTAEVQGAPADATLRYQWYRGGEPIEGATSSSYRIVAADSGLSITCRATSSGYEGALSSNEIGPVVHVITVEYWSYTDASPNDRVVVYTETAFLTDLFNYKYDQNRDDDPSNDRVGYQHRAWRQMEASLWFDSSLSDSSVTMTLEDLARASQWDGVSPIIVYAEMEMREIQVIYVGNGYEEVYDFESVRMLKWDESPYLTGLRWPGRELLAQVDDWGDLIDETTTCGYLLSELMDDPWNDTLYVYLDWTLLEYCVNYVYPVGPLGSAGLCYDMEVYLPRSGFGFDGQGEFVGWFTEPNGRGIKVTQGMLYRDVVADDSIREIDLYAYFVQGALTGEAVISGEPLVGSKLVAIVNGAPADAQLICQWYRGDAAIAGATKATYILVEGDLTHIITCRVQASNYSGTLISNAIGPIGQEEQLVMIEYWSYTNASPDEMVVVHRETGKLSDKFNRFYNQNTDDDPTNDCTGFIPLAWWDANYCHLYGISDIEDKVDVTIAELAAHSNWDGIGAIPVYIRLEPRTITVTYYGGGYEDSHAFETVRYIPWNESPFYVGLKWDGYLQDVQVDDWGDPIDETMTCGYILTELLGTPLEDNLNISIGWVQLIYQIHFVFSDSYSETINHIFDSEITFPSGGLGFDRPGYELLGWFAEPNASGKQATVGMKYCDIVENDLVSETTLYAYFVPVASPDQCQFTINLGAGSWASDATETRPNAFPVFPGQQVGTRVFAANTTIIMPIDVRFGGTVAAPVDDQGRPYVLRGYAFDDGSVVFVTFADGTTRIMRADEAIRGVTQLNGIDNFAYLDALKDAGIFYIADDTSAEYGMLGGAETLYAVWTLWGITPTFDPRGYADINDPEFRSKYQPLYGVYYNADGTIDEARTTATRIGYWNTADRNPPAGFESDRQQRMDAPVVLPSGDMLIRPGYVFAGWSTKLGATQPDEGLAYVDMDGDGVPDAPRSWAVFAEPTTLYAVWAVQEVEILFYLNDPEDRTYPPATLATYPETWFTDCAYTVFDFIPVKEGYIFRGWAFIPEASHSDYQAGDRYEVVPPVLAKRVDANGNVYYEEVNSNKLYALWQPEPVLVRYWAFTDASPDDYVVVHEEYAQLEDLFNCRYDQNKDDDPTNDNHAYFMSGWWDEMFCEYYDRTDQDNGVFVSIRDIAELIEWDGESPINMYGSPEIREIKVTYELGSFGQAHAGDETISLGWWDTPLYYRDYIWQAHRLVGIYDDLGNELTDEMTCGDILSGVLNDPWGDEIVIHYVWEAIAYQVYFVYPNGVTTSQDVEYVEQLALPSEGAGFDYPGYEFVGWFTAADGAGQQVKDDATYASIVRDDLIESLTLYAYFQPVAATTEVLAA